VFERPRSRFVAEFLGYENVFELPGRGLVAVRPEHVEVVPADDPTPPGAEALAGTLVATTYRGTYSTATAVVPLPGGDVRLQGVTGSPEPAPGSAVRVVLPEAAIVALTPEPEESE
jgi:putative spermidine/putrescine transport system ATP-binding protein